MSVMTEQSFQLLPVALKERRRSGPLLTLSRGKAVGQYVAARLSQQAMHLLHQPEYVQVLVTHTHIAVRKCAPSDQHARKVSRTGQVKAVELGVVYGLTPGERFRIHIESDNGHLVGALPAELIERFRSQQGGS